MKLGVSSPCIFSFICNHRNGCMGKCHFILNKRYATKIDNNSASNGSF